MSKVSRNVGYNIIGQGSLLILSFVAVKYVFGRLGEDALGILYFTLAMSSVLGGIVEMGICSTIVREVSSHIDTEVEYIRRLIQTASLIYWSGYVLLSLAVYFGAPLLVEKWIRLRTMDVVSAIRALQVLGVAGLLTLPRALYTSLFRGLQRMEVNNIIDVSVSGLQQLGTVVILALGGGLFPVVSWVAACSSLSVLTYLILASRVFSWRGMIPRYSGGVVIRNVRYSSRMMSITFLSMIHSQADKVIISKLLPIGTMGYYGLAYGTAARATLLTSAIAQAALPSFSVLFKAGDRSALLAQYRKLQTLLCWSIVPILAAVPFAGIPLFGYVFNEETARMLSLPVAFLCVGFYMNGTLNVPYVLSLGMGRPGIAARLNLYALFAVLPVTALLISSLGLAGAGLSLVFYHVFAYVYAVPRICSECLAIPIWEWFLEALGALLLGVITYGGAWAAVERLGDHSVSSLIVAYGGASVAFGAMAYLVVGDDVRRQMFRSTRTLNV